MPVGQRAYDDALRERVRATFPEEPLRRFLDEDGLQPELWVEQNAAALAEVRTALGQLLEQRLKGSGASTKSGSSSPCMVPGDPGA